MAGRDLPPLSALRAFEAAARNLSFRVAAEELGLTQSAISHQVAALEQHFGARLFDRAGRRIALSEPGRLLFPLVRDGFDRLTQGADLLRRSRMTDDLRVQVYVTVAVRWLIPRLHRFQSANPNVVVRINTSHFDWEFDADIADLGLICTPSPDRAGLHYDLLFEALLFPVCTPGVAQSGLGLRQPVDLVNHALLQVYTTANDWQLWLDAAGVPEPQRPRRTAIQFLPAGDRSGAGRPGRRPRPAFHGGGGSEDRPPGPPLPDGGAPAGPLVPGLPGRAPHPSAPSKPFESGSRTRSPATPPCCQAA